MWKGDHNLANFSWGIISNSSRKKLSKLPAYVLFYLDSEPMLSFINDSNSGGGDVDSLFFSLCTGGVLCVSARRGVILSEPEPGLSHTWMGYLHGSRPLKSVWVISCQHGGEQQRVGLLKQFSSTGGLLSACQQSDYSIQLFSCLQSAHRASRARPHGYLSIPDTA